jgi:SAM-dependent methyltransferase
MMSESRIDSVSTSLCLGVSLELMSLCLDLQHHSFKIMLDGKLHLAPLSNPQRVLDLATGTGIWAIDFGMSPLLPSCSFRRDFSCILTYSSPGISISHSDWHRSKPNPAGLVSTMQTTSYFYCSNSKFSVPANCRFEVDDAEDDWVFSEPFDFIHARAVVTCFKDNRAMVKKIFDNLTPGGYFELQDPCLPMRSDDGTLDGTHLGE